jgi:hypothetical protein
VGGLASAVDHAPVGGAAIDTIISRKTRGDSMDDPEREQQASPSSRDGGVSRREFVERAGLVGLGAVVVPSGIAGTAWAAGAGTAPAAAAGRATAATISVSGSQFGVSTCYIGANEGNVRFSTADMTDLGINTFRIYGSLPRWEWQDPYPVYGEPTIDQIKADPGVISWAWWDDAMTNPPGGSDYWWSMGSTLWQGNARTIFGSLQAAGIRPVLVLRNVDNVTVNGVFQPAWAPNPPVTAADQNVWWGHVFSVVYWLNVRNNYNVNDFEVHNEPDNRMQGWGGTEQQYMQFVQLTHDAISYVYQTYLPGRAYHVYAPVTKGGSSWPLDALQQVAPYFDSVDIHDYNSDISGYVEKVHGWMDSTGHSSYPLWITEWGTYLPGNYTSASFSVSLIQNLIRASQPGADYVYGSHIFALYDWSAGTGGFANGGFQGLIDASGNRRPAYYATRIGIRALQGCRPTYASTSSTSDLMAITTKDASGQVWLLVTNSSSTAHSVTADLSALVTSATATMWQFDSTHNDVVVAQPVLAGGRVTFTVPATAGVLLLL